MKGLFAVAVCVVVVGCQNGGVGMAESPAWFMTATPEQQVAYFGKRCTAYGFKQNTNEMAQCIMIESRSSKNNAGSRMAMASQAMANSAPRPVSTTCNRFGNTLTCNSY